MEEKVTEGWYLSLSGEMHYMRKDKVEASEDTELYTSLCNILITDLPIFYSDDEIMWDEKVCLSCWEARAQSRK